MKTLDESLSQLIQEVEKYGGLWGVNDKGEFVFSLAVPVDQSAPVIELVRRLGVELEEEARARQSNLYLDWVNGLGIRSSRAKNTLSRLAWVDYWDLRVPSSLRDAKYITPEIVIAEIKKEGGGEIGNIRGVGATTLAEIRRAVEEWEARQ